MLGSRVSHADVPVRKNMLVEKKSKLTSLVEKLKGTGTMSRNGVQQVKRCEKLNTLDNR